MDTGQRIKKRRKELGVSADKLAQEIGVNRATIFRYEKGDIDKIPVDVLKPIADALRTTPAFLMGWEEVQKNNDAIADVVVELRSNEEYLSVCLLLKGLEAEKLQSVKQMLSAFLK